MHPLYRRRASSRPPAPLTRLSALLLALLVLSLPACDFGPAPANPTPTPTTLVPPTPTVPDRPRTGTIFARLSSDVLTLNPWFGGMDRNTHDVTGLIFSGLTRLDNHLLPQPDLAERWEVSEDGTQLTFHLRRDVRWHDGEPFTSQDVVWSYSTLRRISAENTATLHVQERVRSVEAV
ncbi:MAG TPA: ABC transporter substrate-binding protein, partial [Chloroflexia bacterium]|nr:ABC transporter substrate-binding protein [Chloroflexia bacterium]